MTRDYLKESIETIKQTSSTLQGIDYSMPGYSEATALQQLRVDADEAFSIYAAASEILATTPDMLSKELDASISVDNLLNVANAVDFNQQFTININGKQHAFMLGAAQYEALIQFIKHIVNENLYELDFDKKTVVDMQEVLADNLK